MKSRTPRSVCGGTHYLDPYTPFGGVEMTRREAIQRILISVNIATVKQACAHGVM